MGFTGVSSSVPACGIPGVSDESVVRYVLQGHRYSLAGQAGLQFLTGFDDRLIAGVRCPRCIRIGNCNCPICDHGPYFDSRSTKTQHPYG